MLIGPAPAQLDRNPIASSSCLQRVDKEVKTAERFWHQQAAKYTLPTNELGSVIPTYTTTSFGASDDDGLSQASQASGMSSRSAVGRMNLQAKQVSNQLAMSTKWLLLARHLSWCTIFQPRMDWFWAARREQPSYACGSRSWGVERDDVELY